MKKTLSIALVIMLVCTSLFTGACAESPLARSSNCFHVYGTSMRDNGGGVLSITFHCVGMGVCSQLGVASFSVQRQDDDGNWVDITGILEGEVGTNVASYTFGRYFDGIPGETYRLCVTFVGTLNGVMEHKYHISDSITVD